jgi:hypothetical protein
MSNSETIEQLAAAIGEEIYMDIAKWHLYLKDANLHTPLAESFYALISDQQFINESVITKVLNDTNIVIGGGKKQIPLFDLIPKQAQARLLEILENFSDKH